MSTSEHIHYGLCVFVIGFVLCEGRLISYVRDGPKWSLHMLTEGDKNPASLKEAEPGFDLTREEMDKFKIWPAGVIPYFIDNLSFGLISYVRDGPKWSLHMLTEGDKNPASLKEAEPGFDLTREEMDKFKIWPAGVIPYFIDNLSFDKVIRDRLRTFLNSVNAMTGLQFVELQEPPDSNGTRFVLFINRIGQLDCEDHTTDQFTNQGVQRVLLGYNCFNDRDLSSVVLALAGVPPQHNAPNRDEYVSIEMANILPDKKHLFKKLSNTDWLFHDIEYDFRSAGHYPLHKYTSNGIATIKPLEPLKTDDVGMGEGFSYSDIWKIRMLYSYIKIKAASKKLPCDKIFRPGADFDRYSPGKEDDVHPRKKPNKYVGSNGADENNNENDIEHQDNGKVENEDNKQGGTETDKMNDHYDIEKDKMYDHYDIKKDKMYYQYDIEKDKMYYHYDIEKDKMDDHYDIEKYKMDDHYNIEKDNYSDNV